tara:strand:+ start:44 stop:469 length:426 start_codon:yes stop_codon:yes gene_type:complete
MLKEILRNNDIILFDGVCLLCNKYVLFINKRNKDKSLFFMSIQNKKIKELTDIHKFNTNDISSILVITKEKVISKSEAIIYILSKLGFPYNISIILKIIPKDIRDIVYNLVAKNRYKIFKKLDSCELYNNEYKTLQKNLIK